MDLIEKNKDYTPSQMADFVINNTDYSVGFYDSKYVYDDVPWGYDYNIRDTIMQIISFNDCKGVLRLVNRSYEGVDASRLISRRVPYGISMGNIEVLKSDIRKECPTGFYLCVVDLLRPSELFSDIPSARIQMLKHRDMTMLSDDGTRRKYDKHYRFRDDVERDPHGAWRAIQHQAQRIEELETLVKRI